jgi:Domain of unknown function (DUF4365)
MKSIGHGSGGGASARHASAGANSHRPHDGDLRQRQRDQKDIFDVKNPRHLTYWTTQPCDVYLVIRDSAETIRWLNVSAYLKTRRNKQSKQITFDGEKLDAPAIWRLRDRYIKRAYADAVK